MTSIALPGSELTDAARHPRLRRERLSNDVSVIDTRSMRAIQTIPADDGPWGLATE